MASVNKVKHIYTHEGAKARNISPLQQLERSVMSCLLWEGEFYESGVSIAQRISELVKQNSPDDVLNVALKAKHDMHLRHIPLFLIREVFRNEKSRKLAGETLYNVISRPDDITEFLALYWKDDSQVPLAKQAKIALGKAFHKFDEYQLAKYSGGNKAIKLVDALRIVHPEKSELLGKLRRGELATPDTWEVEISKGACESKKDSWTRMLQEKKLGGLALLRNIRGMREAGVDDTLIKEGIKSLKTGKLLPINFIAAGIHNAQFESEIENKFFEAFNKEKVEGRTIMLVDVSGSMDAKLSQKSELKRLDVAASLSMIARETFAECRIILFSDYLAEIPARRGFAIRDLIFRTNHSGTDLGNAIRYVQSQIPHDRLIIITDEQSNSNVPDFKGYLINVASSKNGVGYGSCIHIDGWSDKVINYILEHEKIAEHVC